MIPEYKKGIIRIMSIKKALTENITRKHHKVALRVAEQGP